MCQHRRQRISLLSHSASLFSFLFLTVHTYIRHLKLYFGAGVGLMVKMLVKASLSHTSEYLGSTPSSGSQLQLPGEKAKPQDISEGSYNRVSATHKGNWVPRSTSGWKSILIHIHTFLCFLPLFLSPHLFLITFQAHSVTFLHTHLAPLMFFSFLI